MAEIKSEIMAAVARANIGIVTAVTRDTNTGLITATCTTPRGGRAFYVASPRAPGDGVALTGLRAIEFIAGGCPPGTN